MDPDWTPPLDADGKPGNGIPPQSIVVYRYYDDGSGLLGSGKADVVTTIINKFNTAEKMEHKNFSRDVFLLVDESHRSN